MARIREIYSELIIRCSSCNKFEVGEKIIDGQFCWNCFGITSKEEAASVKCIDSRIIKSTRKLKKNTSWLTIQVNFTNIYLEFNFILNNFKVKKVKISFFIGLGLWLIFYYFFK